MSNRVYPLEIFSDETSQLVSKGIAKFLKHVIFSILNSNETLKGIIMLYGYARVSTLDQDHSRQEESLAKAGCEVIRAEKKSGTKIEGRDELKLLLKFIRKGDVLVVTRLDRLARSMLDLQTIVAELKKRALG